jgi:hypothetical protein
MARMAGVAKEIIRINPYHRIMFVSAYVDETMENSVKQLNIEPLIYTIEAKYMRSLKLMIKNI